MSAESVAEYIPPGYKQTEVGVIPEDWKFTTVGQLFQDKILEKPMDGNHGNLHPKTGDFVDYGIPFIMANNVRNGRIDLNHCAFIRKEQADSLQKGFSKSGDVLLTHKATIGNTAIVEEIPFEYIMLTPQVTYYRVSDKTQLNSFYLLHFFNSNSFQTTLLLRSGGGTRAYIGITAQLQLPVILPPTLAEQESIATALSDTDALIESLEQLIAKKHQIKQGAMQELLTGKRRLPGFSGEWEMKLLGEVIASCSSGATPYRGRPDYYKGKVKWITSGELNYNLITDTLEHISKEAVEHTNLKIHPIGTFLMAITGLEAAGTRGACGIVGSPATTNQSCMAVYPTSELKTEYLYHYYVFCGNELALQYCQGTKQQSYTAKLVKLLPINLPPSIEEQTAIATILSDMDAEITSLEEKLAKTRQMKQGMMQELLTGRIRLI